MSKFSNENPKPLSLDSLEQARAALLERDRLNIPEYPLVDELLWKGIEEAFASEGLEGVRKVLGIKDPAK